MVVYSSIKEVCENALISLYLEVGTTNRFVPQARRTQLLKVFIKPLIKRPEFKCIKKELKQLTLVNDSFSLECKIIELLDGLSGVGAGKSKSEADLFDFLADLYEHTGLDIKVSNRTTAAKVGTIYILDDEIATKISNDGNYLEPVCLYVYFPDSMVCNDFLAICAKDERFVCSIKKQSVNHACIDVLPS